MSLIIAPPSSYSATPQDELECSSQSLPIDLASHGAEQGHFCMPVPDEMLDIPVDDDYFEWSKEEPKKPTCPYKASLELQSLFSWKEGRSHGVTPVTIADHSLLSLAPKKMQTELGKPYTGRSDFVMDSEERENLRIQYWAMLSKKRTQSVATIYAIGNNLLYHAAECFDVFQWEEHESGKRSIIGTVREQMTEMNQAFKDGQFVLHTALSHTVGFINKFWPEASQSRRAISGWIDWLCELDLLSYVSQRIEFGQWGMNRRYNHIDVERLLILLEAAEEVLGSLVYESVQNGKDSYTVNARGTSVRALYNALFTGWGFRRVGAPDTNEPDTWEGTDEAREQAQWSSLSSDGALPMPIKTGIEAMKESFSRLLEHWRSARANLGANNEVTQELRRDWLAIAEAHPEFLGG